MNKQLGTHITQGGHTLSEQTFRAADSSQVLGMVAIAPSGVRSETFRDVERAEYYKAIDTLVDLGVFKRLEDANTYHGRVGDKNEVWRVDPSFKNGSNDSGNYNVNSRSTLYATDEENAKKFAGARAEQEVSRAFGDSIEQQIKDQSSADIRKTFYEADVKSMLQTYESLSSEDKIRFLDPSITYFLFGDEARLTFIKSRIERTPPEYTNEPLSQPELRRARRELENSLTDQQRAEMKEEVVAGLNQRKGVYVHKILSEDLDAVVLTQDFEGSKLEGEQAVRYWSAIKMLMEEIPYSIGHPAKLGQEEHFSVVLPRIKELFQGKYTQDPINCLITKNEAEKIAADAGVSADVAVQLAGVRNARTMLAQNMRHAVKLILNSTEELYFAGEDKTPISVEYIENFMRMNHIVGLESLVISATINRQLAVTSLINLQEVNSQEALASSKDQRRSIELMGELIWSKLGSIAQSELGNEVLRAEIHPIRTIKTAQKVRGFGEIFTGRTGVWEGYTLDQHTMSVLDNFENNFVDDMPFSTVPFMRLLAIVHDIGKPVAVAKGQKYRQKEYNSHYAPTFLKEIGAGDDVIKLMVGMITDGAEFASSAAVFGADSNLGDFRRFAKQELEEFKGSEVSEEEVDGYLQMCEILVTCDGGAYTDRAITPTKSRIAVKNHASFNSSFEESVGLGGRDLRLRNRGIVQRSKQSPR